MRVHRLVLGVGAVAIVLGTGLAAALVATGGSGREAADFSRTAKLTVSRGAIETA